MALPFSPLPFCQIIEGNIETESLAWMGLTRTHPPAIHTVPTMRCYRAYYSTAIRLHRPISGLIAPVSAIIENNNSINTLNLSYFAL